MITDINFILQTIPRHADNIHKGERGRVLVIGGSKGLTGAVCMCANAALRSGAGLITAAVPESLNNIFEVKLTEVMTLPVDDFNGEITSNAVDPIVDFALKCDAIAIGPGAGLGKGIVTILDALCGLNKKLIIDADAITVLSENLEVLSDKKAEILITPHVGEMSRLLNVSCENILAEREKYAQDFSRKYDISVLLKGKNTVITNGDEIYINPTGNNGMAKGGSGDVLTGICAALVAQGLSCFEAGIVGAYIHGMAGDIANEIHSEFSMTPSDIIECLGLAYKKIKGI